MKRSSVRGAKGPCHLQSLRRKEGKDEMIKASIDLQDLRRRIYVKVKAEPSWRFGRSCDTTILSDSQPNRGCLKALTANMSRARSALLGHLPRHRGTRHRPK